MTRKLFGLFSGTHLTFMVIAGLFTPGLLHAVPTFSNVAIEDIVTGNRATVDPGKRLYVNDPVGNYGRTPTNLVRAFLIFGNGCNEAGTTYTVPAGRALIITALTFYMTKVDPAGSGAGGRLWADKACSKIVALASSSDLGSTLNENFETGLPIPAGSVLTTDGANGTGNLLINGFLVPATTLPAAETAEAAAQIAIPPRSGVMTVRGSR